MKTAALRVSTLALLCVAACAGAQSSPGGTRDTTSFACGSTRCKVGQMCCPFGSSACISEGQCDNDDALAKKKPEVPDYSPFSNTGNGYACNPRTHEPCAAGQSCRIGKVGRGPLTMTSACGE
jgi:hypothetical protein